MFTRIFTQKMKFFRICFILGWCFNLFYSLHAQIETDTLDILTLDSLPPVQRSGLFDFVFSRSYIINADFREDVPLIPAESGTSSIGLSFNRVINKKIGIHFQPVFKTLRLSFKNDINRTFPNDPDTTLASQKYRMYYLASDVGFRYNFKKDEKNRPVTFFELGFSFGWNVGNSEKKMRFYPNEKVKIKSSNIANLNRFYAASYLKVNYRWLGLYFQYRYTPIFKKNATYRYDLNDFRQYPDFPSFEVGFCLVL